MEMLAVVEHSTDLCYQNLHNTSILARKFRHMEWLIREVTEIDLCLSSVKWESRFSQTVVEASYPSPEGKKVGG